MLAHSTAPVLATRSLLLAIYISCHFLAKTDTGQAVTELFLPILLATAIYRARPASPDPLHDTSAALATKPILHARRYFRVLETLEKPTEDVLEYAIDCAYSFHSSWFLDWIPSLPRLR